MQIDLIILRIYKPSSRCQFTSSTKMTEPTSDPRLDRTLRKATQVIYGGVKENAIRLIPCTSWDDFARKVRVTPSPMLGRVFRGQCNSAWGLQSKWDRYADQKEVISESKRAIAGRHDTADLFLERFKALSIGTLGFDTSSLTREQWMALGRHHGLITPLLDWTHSPFVAAFFAFRELLPIDRELGCLNPLSRVRETGAVAIWELPVQSNCNNLEHFAFVFARHDFAHRQRAQSGLFTLVEAPEHCSLDEYLTAKNYAHCLKRYEIPQSDALIAMQDLRLMNITDNTMFPDGDGAARQANLGEYFDWASLMEHLQREET